MRIALDIDGVLYKWDLTAGYMLREVLPDSPYRDEPLLKQESSHWNHIQDIVAPEHWNWLWTEGVRLGLFRHGHLYKGTIQAVRALAKLGEVVLITHRPKSAVNDTLAWAAYQQLPLAGIHILTNGEPKSSAVPHCDFYLDDKPENCEDLRSTGAEVFIYRRPWNTHWIIPSGSGIGEVNCWQDYIGAVEVALPQ